MVPVETSRRSFLRVIAATGAGLVIPTWLPRPGEAAFRGRDVPSRVTLSDLEGNSVVIPTDFKGQVVVIHFWASWCPSCRAEMRTLESLYSDYRGKGVTPCSIGIGENKGTAMRYLKGMTISYPVLLDPDFSMKKPFGVAGVPTYFVLDREGAIRHKIIGKADREGLDKLLRSLL